MKKLRLLASTALASLSFLASQNAYGTDEDSRHNTQNLSSLKGPLHVFHSGNGTPFDLLSSLTGGISYTLGSMRESALNGCDRFGRWMASYAEDLPPVCFSKSFLEIDYAHDDLFWQGHFYQELSEIKQAPFLGSQELVRLNDLQEIVWNGFVSPYVYEKGLKDLGKKELFSQVQNTRNVFRLELKENSDIVLPHLQKDLLNFIGETQNNRGLSHKALISDFRKMLSYYMNILNTFDYAETVAALARGMEQNKGKLALTETQYRDVAESLTYVLHKTDKEKYSQAREERKFNKSFQGKFVQDNKQDLQTTALPVSLIAENKDPSFFSYPLSFVKGAGNLVKRGISFTLENPMQAITMGLAFQAAAVAAKSPFSLLPHFQKVPSSSNVIDLANFSSTQGIAIQGIAESDSGFSVSSAGDFNGDGISDIIVGADMASPQGRYHAGASYVIYGRKDGYPTSIDLASLNATQGVIIQGAGGSSGWSVSSAGDFNGDGLGDVIVGALDASPQGRIVAGASYIIYGQKGGYLYPIDLASLNANQGVIIQGATVGDHFGSSVSSAGDFNGDGISDIIVGANTASPQGRHNAGASYIIYGRKDGYPTSIDLASLNATQGVIIQGATTVDQSGSSVSSAGDFNGDGLSDVIVGAFNASPQGRQNAGASYIIYGQSGYPTSIDLASLNIQGVIIQGAKENDGSGSSVSSAGDFNGDGLSDVIIGACASPRGRWDAGASYIIYGQSGYPTSIDLASLNVAQGVIIQGATVKDHSGFSVSSAGDFNGDGLSDVIIGAPDASPGRFRAGSSYVIYGHKGGYLYPIDLASLNVTQGVIIEGAAANDWSGCSVSLVGDFNGDGLSDVIVGAPYAYPQGRHNAGSSYVIYGNNTKSLR